MSSFSLRKSKSMTCKKLSVFWNWLEDIKLEANRNIPYFLKCVFEIFPFGFEILSFNYNFYKPKLLTNTLKKSQITPKIMSSFY